MDRIISYLTRCKTDVSCFECIRASSKYRYAQKCGYEYLKRYLETRQHSDGRVEYLNKLKPNCEERIYSLVDIATDMSYRVLNKDTKNINDIVLVGDSFARLYLFLVGVNKRYIDIKDLNRNVVLLEIASYKSMPANFIMKSIFHSDCSLPMCWLDRTKK